ncbi:MAG: NfeD family protein [Desulfonatronovibrio sp. MSAO_Bac4]|nr:MAG: NfeD family protein [Desulfonatronovibrio sp. MSAO_Bac4]
MIFPAWLIWFVLSVIVAFLELYLPGFILLFFAIGCLSTAAALLVFDINLTQQILVFLITSVSSLLLLRKWMMRTFQGASSSNDDSDFDDFPYGVRVQVLQKISPQKTGRIQYRGTAWDATADENINPGETVEILKFSGNSKQIFVVRKIS